MKHLVHNFIESLREELKQYGELLALLDTQQDQVIRRLASELIHTVAAIESQGDTISAARHERAQRQRELAQELGLGGDSRVGAMLPLLPDSYRPLIGALVDENNHLLTRVRQRAKQNHILMGRALELMDKFMSTLCGAGTPTYNQAGTMAAPAAPGRPLYEQLC